MRNLILFIFILVGISPIVGQQNPISNFYQFNEYLLNPSEAGSQNKLEGTLSHRLQWRGIEGAPETSFLGIHGAINENMGIGGRLIIDQSDILQQFSGAISYAYRIQFSESKRIMFGISALGMQNNIRFGDIKVSDQTDELITNGDVEGLAVDAEAGITIEINQLRVGFSSAQLFESGVDFELPARNGTFDRARSFNSYFSYTLTLNSDWKVDPMIMIRNQRVKSFQFELNALFAWQEKLFLGAGYRDQAGYIAKAGFQVSDQLLAAYAYEFSNTGIASYSNGSHEFMLSYRIPKAKKKETIINEESLPTPITNKEQDSTQEKNLIKKTTEEIQPEKEAQEELVETTKVLDTIASITPPIEENIEVVTETPIKEIKTKEIQPSQELITAVFDQVIYFEFKKSTLSNEGEQKLERILKTLKKSPHIRLNISGHTCSLGNNAINRMLSLARANTVRNYFISRGIDGERLTVVPMLDRKPAVLNDTFDHRKQNRRVEFEPITKP